MNKKSCFNKVLIKLPTYAEQILRKNRIIIIHFLFSRTGDRFSKTDSSNDVEAAHENEPRLAVPSCHLYGEQAKSPKFQTGTK